jgi:hypothetical protein
LYHNKIYSTNDLLNGGSLLNNNYALSINGINSNYTITSKISNNINGLIFTNGSNRNLVSNLNFNNIDEIAIIFDSKTYNNTINNSNIINASLAITISGNYSKVLSSTIIENLEGKPTELAYQKIEEQIELDKELVKDAILKSVANIKLNDDIKNSSALLKFTTEYLDLLETLLFEAFKFSTMMIFYLYFRMTDESAAAESIFYEKTAQMVEYIKEYTVGILIRSAAS